MYGSEINYRPTPAPRPRTDISLCYSEQVLPRTFRRYRQFETRSYIHPSFYSVRSQSQSQFLQFQIMQTRSQTRAQIQQPNGSQGSHSSQFQQQQEQPRSLTRVGGGSQGSHVSSHSRHSVNSTTSSKLKAETKNQGTKESDKDCGFGKDSVFKELSDSEPYECFEKLWMSSKNQESVLQAQWDCLMEAVKKEEKRYKFSLNIDEHVGVLFAICRKLKTNYIVRFRALELYERYLRFFMEKIGGRMNNCSPQELDEFLNRFERQFLLRICTCILLASKLHTDQQTNALKPVNIQTFLKDEGQKFTCKNICSSELRVLETLNYRCHWITPLEVTEQLLCILNLSLEFFKGAHYFCVLLLEYYYSDMTEIRKKFASRTPPSEGPPGNSDISIPLQCAGIVTAALFLIAAELKAEGVHKRVAEKALLPPEDVEDLATIILTLLMGNNSPQLH